MNMENQYICKFCGKPCKNANSLRNHERLCPQNPDRIYVSYTLGHTAWNKGLTKETDARVSKSSETLKLHYKDGSIKPSQLGRPLTEEHKRKISNGMKIAHQESRAHNIGMSRWNNEHSWPEKWFIEMLKNELNMVENIDYKTEMPFDKYSLDFAWPERKLCIEIDGEQHERFEEYQLRDIAKDKLLTENGWQVIRIKWKDCFHNTKKYIEQVKSLF